MKCRKASRSSSRSHVGRRMPFQCVSYKTAIAPPQPRTHWWPVILATSIRIEGVETSSVVTWYGGDLVAKACKTYCVRPAGRCRGMPSASYGLAQGLQRAAVTWGLAAGPERFEGRSRYSSLSPSGRPSGVSAAEERPTAIILKGPVQFSESFSLKTLLSAPFRYPWRIIPIRQPCIWGGGGGHRREKNCARLPEQR